VGESILTFVSGALLFNAIPHLVRGICGDRHMTPFSRTSSAVTNVIWAWINIVIGGWLLMSVTALDLAAGKVASFAAGGFVLSLSLAWFWSNPEARLPWHKQ
jgi:hypothetical protein